MAAIFYVSSLPEAPLPPGVSDLPAHWAAYLVLGVLVLRAIVGGLPARIRLAPALLAIAITVAYGALDEFHQGFVPGRVPSLSDLTADAAGAVAGAAACWAWGIISRRPDV